jgi:hypothetical protein
MPNIYFTNDLYVPVRNKSSFQTQNQPISNEPTMTRHIRKQQNIAIKIEKEIEKQPITNENQKTQQSPKATQHQDIEIKIEKEIGQQENFNKNQRSNKIKNSILYSFYQF